VERAQILVDVWVVPAGTRLTREQRATPDGVESARLAAMPAHVADRFVLGRVLLRAALAARWACPAARVELRSRCPMCGGAHGQVRALPPRPAPGTGTDADGADPIHVSITRAGPVVAVALCADAPVGIDAELRAAIAAAPLADVALSRRELAALPTRGGRRRRAVARAWVRKEAALKALGTGLTVAPADIELCRPRERVRGVVAVAPGGVAVADLPLGAGHVGAVAVAAPLLGDPAGNGRVRTTGALLLRRYDGARLLEGRR
jgi:4'-phosphopantetheinyl transferase